MLFGISYFGTLHIRHHRFQSVSPASNSPQVNLKESQFFFKRYFMVFSRMWIWRWVGIDGVMTVSSYPKLSMNLWEKSWQERFKGYGTSLYDREFRKTDISTRRDIKKHHFVSMPGMIGFLFYSGSYFFLFGAMFLLSIFGAGVEWCALKAGQGNLILASLIAQVVAYRFAHFGYVPARSYLLFGSIFLNLGLIFLINFLLERKISSYIP